LLRPEDYRLLEVFRDYRPKVLALLSFLKLRGGRASSSEVHRWLGIGSEELVGILTFILEGRSLLRAGRSVYSFSGNLPSGPLVMLAQPSPHYKVLVLTSVGEEYAEEALKMIREELAAIGAADPGELGGEEVARAVEEQVGGAAAVVDMDKVLRAVETGRTWLAKMFARARKDDIVVRRLAACAGLVELRLGSGRKLYAIPSMEKRQGGR